MRRLFTLSLLVAALASCADTSSNGSGPFSDQERAFDLYEHACLRARSGDLAGAFEALEGSMNEGYPTPSHVLTSDDLRALLDAPTWRSPVFELLKSNAREPSITMVRADEPGEPMILTVRLVAGRSEPPEPAAPPVVRSGVIVGFVHVDAAGYYQPWAPGQDWNPRLFGFAVTDETGTVVVRTIRPAHYASEYEATDEPGHVHYAVEQDGRLLRASEFYFDDDPRLVGDVRSDAEASRVPIASIARDDDGVWRADVTIPVRGLR